MPMPCPAGSVCNIPGQSFSFEPCPIGHYCPGSTVTKYYNSSLPDEFKPFVCEEKTFCLQGTATGNVTSDYFRSANHCIEGRYCPSGTL